MDESTLQGNCPGGTLYAIGDLEPWLEDPDKIWIAPGAIVLGDVRIASGASIWFGTVIRGDNEPVDIRAGVNIQEGCTLHNDPGFPLAVGEEATVGHRAILHGCDVGSGALIGMGATIMNGAEIGANSIVGAGALVPEGIRIPPNALAVGMPARVVRELTTEQRSFGRQAARTYRERAMHYKQGLRRAVPAT